MTSVAVGLNGRHISDYLGISSHRLGKDSAETAFTVERGTSCMPPSVLGMAVQQGSAHFLFESALALPIQVSMHVRQQVVDPQEVRVVSHLVRLGRTMILTEGIALPGDDGNAVAFGTVLWTVVESGPSLESEAKSAEPQADDVGDRFADIASKIGIEPLDDLRGCRLAGISPEIAGPGGTLHAGVSQVLCEEAALTVGRAQSDGADLYATDSLHQFLQPGRIGPFEARAEILRSDGSGIDVRVALTDRGDRDRLVTFSQVTIAVARNEQ